MSSVSLAAVTELPTRANDSESPHRRPWCEVEDEINVVHDEIGVLSAQIHMLQAQLAEKLAELDFLDGWSGGGIRTLAQWLSVNAKFAMPEARRIAALSGQINSVPTLFEEAKRGRVSVGVLLNAARIATPANEAKVSDIALTCTPNQSAQIFSKYRDLAESDDESNAGDSSSADGPAGTDSSSGQTAPQPDEHNEFWWRIWHDRKGRGRIDASLDPVTLALMEEAWRAARKAGERDLAPGDDDGHGPGEAEPYDGRPRRLDANEVASRLANTMIDAAHVDGVLAPNGEKFRVQLNIDVETLARVMGIDFNPTGVFRLGSECFLATTGRHLSDAEAARFLCDAGIQVLVHHRGVPMWLSNEHRRFTRHQRRAMAFRSDGRGGCEFPGCTQTRYLDAHHNIENSIGGPTTLDNGILLCGHHHRELHRHAWRVSTDGTQVFTFWEGDRCLGSTTRSDGSGGPPPDICGRAGAASVARPPKPPRWLDGRTPKSDTGGERMTSYALDVFLAALLSA